MTKTVSIGEIYSRTSYYYGIWNFFYKVIDVSPSGKTFTLRRLRVHRDYSDYPYNTMGSEVPDLNDFMNDELIRGKYSKSGNPCVKGKDDKYHSLDLWTGGALEFDHNT